MASWFGFDDGLSLADWRNMGFDIGDIYDDDLEAFDTPGDSEVLFPAMAAVSMGWSWSLLFL